MIANVYKLKKGLDINLKGKAERQKVRCNPCEEFALVPDDFAGVVPKVVVKEGDVVKVGEALFVNKKYPEVKFSTPVSGIVTAIERGERRKVLSIRVKADKEQTYFDYGVKDVRQLDGSQVIDSLLQAGLFGYINQLPYAVSTTPDVKPKAIFISAFRDMPLAADFEFELEGNTKAFQAGLTALSKIAPTYLGIGGNQQNPALVDAADVEVNRFDGPCPAGNVGVQVNHVSPVNKGETVWTVQPTIVIFIGRLFLEGHLDLKKTIAFAGSEVRKPTYTDVVVGQKISSLPGINDISGVGHHCRIINGNPLTGRIDSVDGFVGAHSSEITVIPEGDDCHELFGWIMPRLKDFSANRSYFSWLMGSVKSYALDARIKGGRRHMIMSGEYDQVLPMDILGEFLIKAILAGNIDKMEQLGIYEVSPEDFAVAEFVDSSKLELQRIVREGLDMLRKENG